MAFPDDTAPMRLATEDDPLPLVDLKWLMCAYGDWLDVPRVRREPAYARACLELALAMPLELIRRTAERVLKPWL
ncbi:hypothetical protein C7444_10843 [Sphaerotilus hippei]|uniref:Uncharacterized protein n=1 Tax=Sphaerotilus hippei TaxID=744406 RepID=A0A318GZS1_9BURK|nr:hypothetical protein [Sphaerotilus hippei]PXW95784.1 hypothetical protein C7444_10843 [Sphaerotilus hippei]